jgi:hypothetical protein
MATEPRPSIEWTITYDPVNFAVGVVTMLSCTALPVGLGNPWLSDRIAGLQISTSPDFTENLMWWNGVFDNPWNLYAGLNTNEIYYLRVAGWTLNGGTTAWSYTKVLVVQRDPGFVWVNGNPKPIQAMYVKVAGSWRQAVRYVKSGGVWKHWN